MPSTGLLLVNLGTPRSPRPKDVYRYLIEFLTDGRVIDFPWLKRQLLVRGLIVPTRFRQSARAYSQIWTEEGSPLLVHGNKLTLALQQKLGEDYAVALAMRYQNPSIEQSMASLLDKGIDQLLVFPLFPQYTSATTGSVHQKVMEILSQRLHIPKVTFVNNYADHPAFIEAFCAQGQRYALEDYDHILFSFHGLPQSQLLKADRYQHCLKVPDCCQKSCHANQTCYAAQCHATMQAIVKSLKLSPQRCSICFQSRLGKNPWLQPYASEEIHRLAHIGCQKILVFCPSFVCDCLETIFEIGYEYAAEFKQAGGKQLDLVEGLNTSPNWIEGLSQMIREHTRS